ncbi:MAG: histidine phosphatase family protein [Salinispira sp.]
MQQLSFEKIQQTTQFFFLRHGQSEGNRRNIVQGHQNSHLSDAGREQARAAGTFLSDKNIAAVFSSPLSRAHETARIAAAAAGIDPGNILLRDNLMEIDTGIFSGLNFEEAEKQYPRAWNNFQKYSWEGVPSAESISALLQRAADVWQELIETAAAGAQNILCVSHGGIIQWIIKLSMSSEWKQWMPVINTPNCGIHMLLVNPLGREEKSGRYYTGWHMVNYVPHQGSAE